MFDPMSELTGSTPPPPPSQPRPAQSFQGGQGGGARGGFAKDLHSVTIHGRQRTFYVDLKESGNGKFMKISEKSRGGQKTTIMFDVEDLAPMITALQEMQGHI